MAGVVKRTSNSVEVNIDASTKYTEWQTITVGGSVIFKWKVTPIDKSNTIYNYFIIFSKKIPSDKVNYIITYIHWEDINEMDTPVMRVRSDHLGAVYCPCTVQYSSINQVTVEISTGAVYCPCTVQYSSINQVTVEISTVQSGPCTIMRYDDAELTDFMLRGEDGSVPFHKVVIAAHSSVFSAMLTGEWKETSKGVVDVPGTSKEMLQHLKKYLYLGELPERQNKQVDSLKQLLLFSSLYLMEDLTLRCIKELRFLLTVDNVFDMIQFAIENKKLRLLVEIMDCTAMGDIDMNGVQQLLEAKDATLLKCDD